MEELFDLSGKVALVSGGMHGIGMAIEEFNSLKAFIEGEATESNYPEDIKQARLITE